MTTVLVTSSDEQAEASSLPYPKEAELQQWVLSLVRSTKDTVYDKEKALSDRHNQYTLYVIALLFFATGFRPVRDPFGLLRHVSLKHGLCLIADKVRTESRAFRLVGLPEIARTQLRSYLTYLLAFSSKHTTDSEGLALKGAIEALLDSSSIELPLFFLVDENPVPVHSVTPAILKSLFQGVSEDIINLPENFGRHWLATELGLKGVGYRELEILLGHSESLDHPYGRYSLMAPLTQAASTAQSVDDLLASYGFEAIKPPIRNTGSGGFTVDPLEIQVFSESEVAHYARAATRQARSSHHKAIVRRISGGLDEAIRRRHIQAEDIESSIAQIEQIVREEGGSIRWCQRLFYRWLDRLRFRGLRVDTRRVFVIEPEPSPFRDACLSEYEDACDVRQRFAELCSEVADTGGLQGIIGLQAYEGDSKLAFPVVDRAALCCVSLALHAGLGDKKTLAGLFRAPFRITSHSEGLKVWTDREASLTSDTEHSDSTLTDWNADLMSGCLMIGFKDSSIQFREAKYDAYNARLLAICRYLGMAADDPFAWLSVQSRSLVLLEQPGMVRSACDYTLIHRGLSPVARARLELGVRAKLSNADALPANVVEQLVGNLILPSARRSEGGRPETEYAEWLRRQLNSIENGEPTDFDHETAEPFSRHQASYKARLVTLLEWIQVKEESESKLSPPAFAIHKYAYRIATEGTQYKKDLAWKTVRKHIRSITSNLLTVLGQSDLLSLDEPEYEELYFQTLDRAPASARSARLVALREFHHCLMDEFHVENVDWSYILGLGDWPGLDPMLGIDANIVTYKEYLRSIQIIESSSIGTASGRLKYAALIILGFRFGLRWSEALLLERRDIRWNLDRGYVEIRVRPNLHRRLKTRASRRVIPLLGQLSKSESKILKEVRDQSAQLGQKDPRTLLFNDGADARRVIARSTASYLVNRALKLSSGDSNVRFHHLRHTFSSVLVFMAIRPLSFNEKGLEGVQELLWAGRGIAERDYERLWRSDSVTLIRLRTVSDLLGHGSLGSVSAYFHFYGDVVQASLARPIVQWSLKALAFFLALPYANLRKRLSRCVGKDQEFIGFEDLVLESEIPEHYLDHIGDSDDEEGIALIPRTIGGNEGLSLAEADSLVRRLHVCRDNTAQIQPAFEALSVQPECFLDAALYAEKLTSFRRYGLSAAAGSQSYQNSFLYIDKADENTQLRKTIADVQSRLNELSLQDSALLHRALSIVGKGYRFDRQSIRFKDDLSYAVFLEGMRLAGLGDIVMDDAQWLTCELPEVDAYEAALWDRPVESYAQEAMKYRFKVNRYPLGLRTNTAFYRLLFTVAIQLKYKRLVMHDQH
jgi:integrase